MEEADVDILTFDPNKATIPQLKSLLAKEGVTLPTTNKKKADYVDLFLKLQQKKQKEEDDNKKRKKTPAKAEDSKTASQKKEAAAREDKSAKKPETKPEKAEKNVFQSDSKPTSTVTQRKVTATPVSPAVSSPVTSPVATTPLTSRPAAAKTTTAPTTTAAQPFRPASPPLRRPAAPKRTSSIPLFVKITLGLLLVAGCALAGFYYLGLSVPFCSPETPKDCIPCPVHGKCADGKLICDKGYIQYGKTCIEDEAVSRAAHKLASEGQRLLAEANGRYACSYTERRTLSRSELTEALSQLNIAPSGSSDIAIEKALVLLRTDPSLKVTYLSSSDEYKTGEKTLRSYEDLHFQSEEKRLPWQCWAHLQIVTYKWYELGLVVVIGVVLFALRYRRLQFQERAAVKDLAEKVRRLLQHQQQQAARFNKVAAHVAVNLVRDQLLEPPIDKKKRDRLWMQVRAIIKADSRVKETTMLLHGEQQTVWEWIGPITVPSPASSSSPASTLGSQGAIDDGSTTAVEKRYVGVFPERVFRSQ